MEQLLVVKKDLDDLNLLTAIINLRFVLNKSTRDKSNSKGGGRAKDLILVNQYFSVPQIGEIIRDLWLLNTLSENIEYAKEKDAHIQEHGNDKNVPEPKYPSQQNIDLLKIQDPPMAQTLIVLKDSNPENQDSILIGRANKIYAKYTVLVNQLKINGIDFIIASNKHNLIDT